MLARFRRWLLKQPLFTSVILPAIPRPIRWTLRKIYFLPLDLVDRAIGEQSDMLPPKSEIFVGSVDGFVRSGETLVERLTELADLQPEARVLDIGCGIGRLAIPLTRYLSDAGSYEGLDVVPSGIDWCNEHIASQYGNFRFTLADVFNREYNPSGKFAAADYTFPYLDGTFDLVVLVSVFTHMLPPDMEHYVAEIRRVLREGGRCFATYFLINEESKRLMDANASSLRFNHDLGSYWIVTRKVPELSVGYDESYVRHLYGTQTPFARQAVHYGGWCGRKPLWSQESGLGDQDVVVAVK